MAELADVLDLGSSVARRVGSNPTTRTNNPVLHSVRDYLSDIEGNLLMNRDASIQAIKAAVSGGTYHGSVNAIVENKGKVYLCNDIYASVSYNVGNMQMDVSVD